LAFSSHPLFPSKKWGKESTLEEMHNLGCNYAVQYKRYENQLNYVEAT